MRKAILAAAVGIGCLGVVTSAQAGDLPCLSTGPAPHETLNLRNAKAIIYEDSGLGSVRQTKIAYSVCVVLSGANRADPIDHYTLRYNFVAYSALGDLLGFTGIGSLTPIYPDQAASGNIAHVPISASVGVGYVTAPGQISTRLTLQDVQVDLCKSATDCTTFNLGTQTIDACFVSDKQPIAPICPALP